MMSRRGRFCACPCIVGVVNRGDNVGNVSNVRIAGNANDAGEMGNHKGCPYGSSPSLPCPNVVCALIPNSWSLIPSLKPLISGTLHCRIYHKLAPWK